MNRFGFTIQRLHALDAGTAGELADVLIDCVEGGASVGFMQPLRREQALSFWHQVAVSVGRGERVLIAAQDARGVCGTVQLVLSQPDNQPHRADLTKMLVHRRARRQGVGEALLSAAHATAHESGKTLLVLDTASDTAERLYERLGWTRVGVIPGYALLPYGGLCNTTAYYRDISSSDASAAVDSCTLPDQRANELG
jgi:ribosomal protein S18 acetylase RimI-like enzyme